MKILKAIFAGTPEFSKNNLKNLLKLNKIVEIKGILTKPENPIKTKKTNPTKALAEKKKFLF